MEVASGAATAVTSNAAVGSPAATATATEVPRGAATAVTSKEAVGSPTSIATAIEVGNGAATAPTFRAAVGSPASTATATLVGSGAAIAVTSKSAVGLPARAEPERSSMAAMGVMTAMPCGDDNWNEKDPTSPNPPLVLLGLVGSIFQSSSPLLSATYSSPPMATAADGDDRPVGRVPY